MKAVKFPIVISLVFLCQLLLSQDTLIYKSNKIDLDSMLALLDDYNYQDDAPTLINYEKMFPFKATCHKSYGSGWILVEIDSTIKFESVNLNSKSYSVVTNLRRFVIPADLYVLTVVFKKCTFLKVGLDVSECKVEVKYHIDPPTSPTEDDGMITILESKQNFIWDQDKSFDSIRYNVHTGYYKLNLDSHNGCRQSITIAVMYQGGQMEDLQNFDPSTVIHTKG